MTEFHKACAGLGKIVLAIGHRLPSTEQVAIRWGRQRVFVSAVGRLIQLEPQWLCSVTEVQATDTARALLAPLESDAHPSFDFPEGWLDR